MWQTLYAEYLKKKRKKEESYIYWALTAHTFIQHRAKVLQAFS